jgi:hypothetical protein
MGRAVAKRISCPCEFDGFRFLYPFDALTFLILAPLFIWFAPDMTRKELTDFVGEKVA